MARPKLSKFDPVDHLKTEEDMALYLEACLQEGGDDPAFIAAAHRDIARARHAISMREANAKEQAIYGPHYR